MEIAKRLFFYQYLNPNGFGSVKDKKFHYICQRLVRKKMNGKTGLLLVEPKLELWFSHNGSRNFRRAMDCRLVEARQGFHINR